MEGGGLEWSEELQAIAVGESVGLPYPDLDVSRLRYFGGSSGHWNGLCRAIDAADSAAAGESRRAAGRSAAPTRPLRGRGRRHPRPGPGRRRPPATPGAGRRTASTGLFPRSAPTRFGEKYLDEITDAAGIALGSTPTSSTCGSTTPSPPSRGPSSAATPRTTPASPSGRGLLPLHRRHREPAAAPQLHQPGPGRHRQPERPGRPLLQRPPRMRRRRGDLRRGAGRRDAVLHPDRRLPRRAQTLTMVLHRLLPPQAAVPRQGARAQPPVHPALRRPAGRGGARRRAALRHRRPRGLVASRDPEANPWGRVWSTRAGLNPDSRVTLSDEPDPFGMRRVRLDWQTPRSTTPPSANDPSLRGPARRPGPGPDAPLRLGAEREPIAVGRGRGEYELVAPHVHHPDERRSRDRASSTATARSTGSTTSTSAARASSPAPASRPDLHHRPAGAASRRPPGGDAPPRPPRAAPAGLPATDATERETTP